MGLVVGLALELMPLVLLGRGLGLELALLGLGCWGPLVFWRRPVGFQRLLGLLDDKKTVRLHQRTTVDYDYIVNVILIFMCRVKPRVSSRDKTGVEMTNEAQ